jgi:YegS/Rv2252/BmrU family lipid kinase
MVSMLDGRRVLVILNPVSGSGAASEAEEPVRAALVAAGARAEIRRTGDADDARSWARAAADEGFEVVLAFGGDGTANEVARGLLEAGARADLGLLPVGTGNGLARVLDLPIDAEKAVGALAAGRTVDLDVVEVLAPEGIALLFLGAGLDADINRDADAAAKARFGFFAYVWAVLRRLPRLRGHRVALTLDGATTHLNAHTVTLFNAGRLVLAGVPLGPDADPHDGRVDVAVLRSPDVWRAAAAVERLVTRTGSRRQFERAREVRLDADPPLLVHFDGDVVGTTPLVARVRPAALRVIASARYLRSTPATPR